MVGLAQPLATASFHAHSIASLRPYAARSATRADDPASWTHSPAKKPCTRKRCRGRMLDGRTRWKRQIVAHAVEIDSDTNADDWTVVSKARATAADGLEKQQETTDQHDDGASDRVTSETTHDLTDFFHPSNAPSAAIAAKNLAPFNPAPTTCRPATRAQLTSPGWSSAHAILRCIGCAPFTSAATAGPRSKFVMDEGGWPTAPAAACEGRAGQPAVAMRARVSTTDRGDGEDGEGEGV